MYSNETFFSSDLFRVFILWNAISGSVLRYTKKQFKILFLFKINYLDENVNYYFLLIRSDLISTFPINHLYQASNTAYSGAAIRLSLYKFSTNIFLKSKHLVIQNYK